MLILLFLIGIILLFVGMWIGNKTIHEDLGMTFYGIGIVIIIPVVLITLMMMAAYPYGIDKRIELYETENQKIEEKVKIAVENYLQYENKTFTSVKNKNVDLPILIMTYPELSGNELVKKEIDIYVENTKKIKEMKEERVYKDYYDWWLLFR